MNRQSRDEARAERRLAEAREVAAAADEALARIDEACGYAPVTDAAR